MSGQVAPLLFDQLPCKTTKLCFDIDCTFPHHDENFFFVSSRRRHTRLTCDWSSDVCSSDLRITHTAHTAENLQELLRAIHQIVGELMPAKNFYVSLYDAEKDLLEFPYFVDEIDLTCDVKPRKLRKGLTEYVLRTGQPLLATPEVYERLVAAGEAELIGAPSIDWLGVPLKVKDRTVGVVVTQTYSQGVRYGE